jgi:hypothetical protein
MCTVRNNFRCGIGKARSGKIPIPHRKYRYHIGFFRYHIGNTDTTSEIPIPHRFFPIPHRKLFLTVLHYFGIFETGSSFRKWKIFSFLIIIYSIIFPFLAVLYDVWRAENTTSRIEALMYLFSMTSNVMRVLNFKLKIKSILNILRLFEKIKVKDQSRGVVKCGKTSLKIGCSIIFIHTCLVIVNSINIATRNDGQRIVYKLFEDYKASWKFYMTFIFQLCQLLIQMTIYVSIDCIMFSCTSVLSCHLRCIAVKVRAISMPVGKKGQENRELKSIIEYHITMSKIILCNFLGFLPICFLLAESIT